MLTLIVFSLVFGRLFAAQELAAKVSVPVREGRVLLPDDAQLAFINTLPVIAVPSLKQSWPQNIRVIARPDPAFVPGNPALGSPHSGFLIDLLSTIQKNVGTIFTVVSRPDLRYARMQENGSFEGTLLQPIIDNEADMVGPTMTITSYGEKVVDYLVPIYPYKLEIIYNPNFGWQKGVQYLIMDSVDLDFLKTSKNETIQAIYENIKAGLPNSIVPSSAAGIEKVMSGNFAYIAEFPDPIVKMLMEGNPNQLAKVPGFLGKYFYNTFAVPKGSILRELINFELLKLGEEGILGSLLMRNGF